MTAATVLLVGHGSRNEAGNEAIVRFADLWRTRRPDLAIELCFIEFARPDLEEGLRKVAAHPGPVVVAPLILSAAGHTKQEVPSAIDRVRKECGDSEKFLLAPSLGGGEPVLRLLLRRVEELRRRFAKEEEKPEGIIVLGRGSSHRDANGEVAKMARWIYEETEGAVVDIAFTGVTTPPLEEAVAGQVARGIARIAIQPYYLFTGRLIERIGDEVEKLKSAYPTVTFGLGEPFGFDEEIFDVLDSRIADALAGRETSPCDGCGYLDPERHHHHHDHHPTHEEASA